MLLKSATIVCLFALAQSAVVQQRDIPVEVKYDEAVSEGTSTNGLDDITESSSEISTTAEPIEQKTNAVRNLDEKVQLSTDDLSQASKHIPVVEEISLKSLEDTPRSEVTPAPDTPSIQSVLQQAEDIILNGLKKLRNSFKADKDQQAPNPQQWDDFEKSVNDYLNEQKVKLQLKQDQPSQPPQNQNIFQNIAQGFQTVANNFVQNLVASQSPNSTNQGDEQQGGQGQGPFQGFVNFFQNGVNNLVGSINNLGTQGSTTSNTVLGDTGSGTTQAPGFVSNLVNNVQQFFGQIQGGQNSGSSGTQGDTGVNSTSSGSQQGPGQIIQSIGSAINQFIQGRPPSTSGDEGTGTTESNVNIIQSIGNVIQNSPLNPFRPPQKPAEGGAATTNPIQAGISGAQNIGNQIQQLIPGQASSTEGSKIEEPEAVVQETSSVQPEETSNQVVPELPKEVAADEPEQSTDEEEPKKEELVPIQEEIKEEEVQGEEVKEQMEEQVKQEEIKEEMKQEEMREKVENEKIEEKKEILMTAE